ncbi:hypothetical protein KI387_039288 [Taxus chinensis]|uniref:CCHC-type domain-containing protein n=1 Tax=Taxus chinensis TaxID=29808 RepID=A0AA38C988_TAXCH|nr:hypothetical protein KI387_039288 [Taxus chinensis]
MLVAAVRVLIFSWWSNPKEDLQVQHVFPGSSRLASGANRVPLGRGSGSLWVENLKSKPHISQDLRALIHQAGAGPVVQSLSEILGASALKNLVAGLVLPLQAPSSLVPPSPSVEGFVGSSSSLPVVPGVSSQDLIKVGGIGFQISNDPVKINLSHNWKKNFVEVRLRRAVCCFFQVLFPSTEEVDRVFKEGPWFLNSSSLYVRPWSEDFSPSTEIINRAPLWINLPHLPIEFRTPVVLKEIVDALGSFVPISNPTLSSWKNSSARVCVDMDLSSPLPSFILLPSLKGPWKQQVSFEGLNINCFYCGKMGHLSKLCSEKSKKSSVLGMPGGEILLSSEEVVPPLVSLSLGTLLKESEPVHRDSGILISLIKDGMDNGQAASLASLNSWLAVKDSTPDSSLALQQGLLEDGEIGSECLLSPRVDSALALSMEGLGSADCGSSLKKGKKSKHDKALMEIDAGKQSILKFETSEVGKVKLLPTRP